MAERKTNPFDAPVPGQSLTDTPKNYPWEHAPQFATVEDASMRVWEGLHNDATMDKVLILLDSGLTRLRFSLDAFTPETYSKVRVGSIPLNKVIKNIEYFLELKEKKNYKILTKGIS